MLNPLRRKTQDSNLLGEHADALIKDAEQAEAFLRQHPEAHPRLDHLFDLASQVYKTMVPVEPSPEFVAALKAKLIELQSAHASSAMAWHERRERASRTTHVVGVIVSILAITALVLRLIGSILIIVAFIAGIGRRRPAAA